CGRLVQGRAPVDADHIGADGVHGLQQVAGADAEVDGGHGFERPHGGEGLRGVAGDVGGVVGQGEAAGPGVEELGGRGAGAHLCGQECAGEFGDPVHQVGPYLRLGVHEGAGSQVVLGGATFDEVGGEGEGGAGEPDQGCGAEFGGQAGHRRADRGEEVGIQGAAAQFGDIGGGAHGVVQYGATPGDYVDVDAGEFERDDDVGEEDGGVHAVATHRLQSDLGDHVRIEAGVQHAGALAQAPVFGQRAAGLAHKPDGNGGWAFTAVGADQWRVCGDAVQRVCGRQEGGGRRGAHAL